MKTQILGRGFRLQCPKCGKGKLFRGLFAMNRDCGICRFKFEREPGYFIGAMFLNYGVTAVLVTAGIFTLDYLTEVDYYRFLIIWGGICLIFPIIFFRYSRSLWLSLDYMFDPDR